MEIYTAEVRQLRLEEDGQLRAYIACPPSAIPRPGQYLHAHPLAQPDAPLPLTLFAAEIPEDGEGFIAAPPIPSDWRPGTQLSLRGPLGHGFVLPPNLRHLGLVALGDSLARLMPLAQQAIQAGAAVAVFSDAALPHLPASVEANPMAALADALYWADLLALDGSPPALQKLAQRLGLAPHQPLPCSAQALIEIEMPCGGLAECGVCATTTQRGKYLLACDDGPVIDWHKLIK